MRTTTALAIGAIAGAAAIWASQKLAQSLEEKDDQQLAESLSDRLTELEQRIAPPTAVVETFAPAKRKRA